jgi:hypothetical protein
LTASSPGRIGLVSIHGEVGNLIRVGQYLNGDGFSQWEHAFMDLGDGTVIEAEPGGARIRPLSEYDGIEVYWCDAIYAEVPEIKKGIIARMARDYEHVPYSFLDYDALFVHRLHIPVPGLKDYIASSGHLICSQLVDAAYSDAGWYIFTDHRWTGYVTPGDLYKRNEQMKVRQIWNTATIPVVG